MSLGSRVRSRLLPASVRRTADAESSTESMGRVRGERFEAPTASLPDRTSDELESYFDGNVEGPGIWKWRHYFPVYERHLRKFVGTPMNLVEIGVFSGGSLEMWRSYFGPDCIVHGVDIEPACRRYESDGVHVHIGDQADGEFWARFSREVPQVDVVIDDGGHQADQQIATLDAALDHLGPGGVYICEDILGRDHEFHRYVNGLASNLHCVGDAVPDGFAASSFQQRVESVHLYPFLAVIEMRSTALPHLLAPKRGDQWEPFYDSAEDDR